jgi:hypothetical protein
MLACIRVANILTDIGLWGTRWVGYLKETSHPSHTELHYTTHTGSPLGRSVVQVQQAHRILRSSIRLNSFKILSPNIVVVSFCILLYEDEEKLLKSLVKAFTKCFLLSRHFCELIPKSFV